MAQYQARCHCNALTARYWTERIPAEWSVRACQCSFCRAHGALSTSDPKGSLQFACSIPDLLQRYRFGTGSSDFLICRGCGVYLGAQTTHEGNRFGILNALTLVPVPLDLPHALPVDYSDETAEGRYERRKGRWTPLAVDSI